MTTSREQLGYAIGESARLWRTRLNERLRPLGLSQARWMVLLHLSKRGDGVVQKALAEWIGIESPTLVRILDRMTEDGWIERRESTTDRRAKTVHLTRQANAIIKRIDKIAAQLRKEMLVDIDAADIDACMRVLQQIKHTAERL
ncbi:MAG TPA: MarR family transcriptional regulator [Gammaproteobacteria bacterium]|nr:MarR family transcriptional regulator [Gammaproteobacteria bacterium]